MTELVEGKHAETSQTRDVIHGIMGRPEPRPRGWTLNHCSTTGERIAVAATHPLSMSTGR